MKTTQIIIATLLFIFYCITTEAKDYNVKNFGAKGDGLTLDSPAIQSAINVCTENGGGRVIIPPGKYISSTIQLKNNVTLFIEKNAEILGITDPTQYKNVDPFVDGTGQSRGCALITAVDAKNIGLEGKGEINGRGTQLIMSDGKKMPSALRPFLLRIVRCEGVTIKDVFLKSSAAWTTHFFESRKILIEGIKIHSVGMGNNDGIDIDCSSDIIIKNCDIETGDDAVCFKTTASKLPCKNIQVSGMRLKSNHAGIKFGTESMAPFEDIKIKDCYIYDTRNGGIKILAVDGAKLRNVEISDIKMDNVRTAILMRLGARLKVYRKDLDEKQPIGCMENIVIKNVEAIIDRNTQHKYPSAILITGIPEHNITNVTLDNFTIWLAGGAPASETDIEIPEAIDAYPEISTFGPRMPSYLVWARHAKNLNIKNIKVTLEKPDMRPALFFEDINGIHLNAIQIPDTGNKEKQADIILNNCEGLSASSKLIKNIRIKTYEKRK